MTFAELQAKLQELQTANPNVTNVSEIEGYTEAITEYNKAVTKEQVKAEKDKLYGTINKYKKDATDLAEQNTKLNTDVASYKLSFDDLSKKVTDFTAPTPPTTPETPTTLGAEEIAKLVAETVNKTIQPLMEAQQSLQAESVQQYRERVIATEGDAIIPELIVGSTKEEIDGSVANARLVRTRFNTPVPTPPTPTPETPPTPSPVPPSPTTPTPTPAPNTLLDTVKDMGQSEYESKRAVILEQLRKAN